MRPCTAARPCIRRCLHIQALDAMWSNAAAAHEVKEDNHAAEAALGFPLHTDGPDRLGWLMNMNQVRGVSWGGSSWGWQRARSFALAHSLCERDGGRMCCPDARQRRQQLPSFASSCLPPSPSQPPAPCRRARRWTRRAGRRCPASTATSCARCGGGRNAALLAGQDRAVWLGQQRGRREHARSAAGYCGRCAIALSPCCGPKPHPCKPSDTFFHALPAPAATGRLHVQGAG